MRDNCISNSYAKFHHWTAVFQCQVWCLILQPFLIWARSAFSLSLTLKQWHISRTVLFLFKSQKEDWYQTQVNCTARTVHFLPPVLFLPVVLTDKYVRSSWGTYDSRFFELSRCSKITFQLSIECGYLEDLQKVTICWYCQLNNWDSEVLWKPPSQAQICTSRTFIQDSIQLGTDVLTDKKQDCTNRHRLVLGDISAAKSFAGVPQQNILGNWSHVWCSVLEQKLRHCFWSDKLELEQFLGSHPKTHPAFREVGHWFVFHFKKENPLHASLISWGEEK